MSGTRRVAGLAVVAAMGLMLGSALSAVPRPQAASGAQDNTAGKQPYTMPEYNAEQACAQEKNPATQITCLNDFVSKYPNSALLIYVYPMYVQAYGATKNYAKVIESSQKVVDLGDKVDPGIRYQALYAHCFAYNQLPAAQQSDATQAKGAIQAASDGLKTLEQVKKPDNMTDDQFAAQKKQIQVYFNGTAAQAALNTKDYPTAVQFYKAVLTLVPDEPGTNYNLGKVYLAMAPPQPIDAMWYVARAVSSKSATPVQVKQLTPYLNKLIQNYQGGTVCDSITDSEQKELLQLASSSADRPSSYTLPASADLDAARKDMTIASVVADLKAGGDKSKISWMAACGLEFPGVPGKVIEVTPGASDSDPIDFKIAFVTSDAEFDAATVPNMEVKVAGQPEAKRVEKDGAVHFTATLVSYDPDPNFMLHWEKGKIADEDIPKEKGTPKKTTKKKSSGD
jgi:tetratricopeptide (TPR) repeat protein